MILNLIEQVLEQGESDLGAHDFVAVDGGGKKDAWFVFWLVGVIGEFKGVDILLELVRFADGLNLGDVGMLLVDCFQVGDDLVVGVIAGREGHIGSPDHAAVELEFGGGHDGFNGVVFLPQCFQLLIVGDDPEAAGADVGDEMQWVGADLADERLGGGVFVDFFDDGGVGDFDFDEVVVCVPLIGDLKLRFLMTAEGG